MPAHFWAMKVRTEVDSEDIPVLGHRGFRGSLENTMPAFRRALRYANGIEFDVRTTKDGKLVAHHDGTFKSEEGAFRVNEVSLPMLRKLHPLGPLVPEVSEVLSLDAALLNADVKEREVVEPLVNIIERRKAIERTIFSADEPETVTTLLRECPDCRVGLSIVDYRSMAWLFKTGGLYSVHVPIDVVSYIGYRPFITLLRVLRRRKLRVYLWNYRMDELLWVPRLIHLVDAVISDDPARLRKVFRCSSEVLLW